VPLAIFDLDNTLLQGDSDHRWGEYMCASGRVDAEQFARQNDQFYADYTAGTLDIHAYLRFALSPIAGLSVTDVEPLQREFMAQWVEPMILPQGLELLESHRQAGDQLLIITATNTVVTRPIASRLGVETLLGCEAEIVDSRYSGDIAGIPTFQHGKVERLKQWAADQKVSLEGAFFYSDSHNDLPLLELVTHPVAVDPDAKLLIVAKAKGWSVISLRDNGDHIDLN